MKLIKGNAVKIVDPESSLVPLLKAQGWSEEGGDPSSDHVAEEDHATLLAKAETLGLRVHARMGTKKLAALIEEAEKNGHRA